MKLMFDPPCDLCLSLAPSRLPSQRSLALGLEGWAFSFTEEREEGNLGVSPVLALAQVVLLPLSVDFPEQPLHF